MRWLIFTTSLLAVLGSVECLSRYRLRGHIPHSNDKQLGVREINKLINDEISQALAGAHPTVSHIREVPRQSKSAQTAKSMLIEVELTLDTEMSSTIFHSKNVRFTAYKEIDSVRDTNNTSKYPEPDCYNDGYLGPDGSCVCPERFTGFNCALLECYNGGIQDYYLTVPQCFCPPGYNDFFCANRGCRPAVQDDINPPSTNLIVIMPATDSFNASRQDIMSNFEFLVNAINTYEDTPWLGLYVGVNYWADEYGETATDVFTTSNLTEFISRMSVMDNLQLGNATSQDSTSLLDAIDLSLWDTFDGRVSGNPMVFGYSNAPNNRGEYLDDSFTYQANYWRAKVFINIINDNTTQINTSSAGFIDYRTYSQVTFSPVLYYSSDEIDLIHSTVLTRIYKPQYIDVRSQASGASGLVEAMRDYQDYSRLMQVLVTSNQPMDQGKLSLNTLVGNISISSDTSGNYFAIYTLPPTSWDGFRYTAAPGSTFSFYTFISSTETALWAGHDDPFTDIGDIVTNAEAGYHFAVTPVAFKKPVIGIDYQSIGSSDAGIIYKAKYLNQKPGCTLHYEFEKISHCTPGTFVHQVVVFTEAGAVTRVFPGICAHTLMLPQPPKPENDDFSFTLRPPQSTTAEPVRPVCPVEGTMAFADNRNHPFRDFIFAVEWSDNDATLIVDLVGIIPDMLDAIYDVEFQQRFTFIVFNKKYVKAVVSQTRRVLFEQRVTNILNSEITEMLKDQMNDTESSSDSVDSVIMANLQTLNPKGQAYIFAHTTGPQTQPNLLKIFPKSFQVNYFYHTLVYDSYPFALMTRQTNGRWYSAQDPGDFITAFLPETVKSDLIYDEVYQAPLGMPFSHNFMVEKSATALEVLINGALRNFAVVDSTGEQLQYNSSFDGQMGLILADISNRSTEQYTLQVSCTYCTIQIRVASPLRVILGFTADLDDDTKYQAEPSAWLRLDRNHQAFSYVAARVTGLDLNETITTFQITAMIGSYRGPSFTANSQSFNDYMRTQMQLRNSSQCSYQYIGQIQSFYETAYWTPDLDGLKFLIEIKTNTGMKYTRMVYYYLPAEMKDPSICQNNATVDQFGVCQCTASFTGELCTVPVCQSEGVQNFGACNCQPSYAGRFCEIAITEKYYPNATSTVMPTTTQPLPATSTPPPSIVGSSTSKAPQSSPQPIASSTVRNTPVVTQPKSTVTQPPAISTGTSQSYQSTQATSKTTTMSTAPPVTQGAGNLLVTTVLISCFVRLF